MPMEYIASISYGKDSCTIPHVCFEVLKLPLTKLVTVDVMFNDELSGDYPEVAEFKQRADEIFKQRYGLEVVHLRAKMTYEQQFFSQRGSRSKEENIGKIYGFPMIRGAWCNNRLKMQPIEDYKKLGNQFWYIGYALDEKKHERQEKIANCTDLNMYPLVKAKYTEGMCMDWCRNNNLLNPTYQSSLRDGCWFCHNQGLDQLRKLRKHYPQLWERLMYLDLHSPVTFKPDGVTVADLDRRFALEDAQMTIFDFIE